MRILTIPMENVSANNKERISVVDNGVKNSEDSTIGLTIG